MAKIQKPPQNLQYICPDGRHPISRSVHLGRLAAFYPACRNCPRRDDTGALPPGRVEQLEEVCAARPARAIFSDEGINGVFHSELTPQMIQRVAAAFGAFLREADPRPPSPPHSPLSTRH